jgi:hypothetical protein
MTVGIFISAKLQIFEFLWRPPASREDSEVSIQTILTRCTSLNFLAKNG